MPSRTTQSERVRSDRVEAHEAKKESTHLQDKQDAHHVCIFVKVAATGESVTVAAPLQASVNQLLESVLRKANIGLSTKTPSLCLLKSGSALRHSEASLKSAGIAPNETLLLAAGELPGGAYRRVNDTIPDQRADVPRPITREVYDMTPWQAAQTMRAKIKPDRRGPRGGLINADDGVSEAERSSIEAFISTLRVREPIVASLPDEQQELV